MEENQVFEEQEMEEKPGRFRSNFAWVPLCIVLAAAVAVIRWAAGSGDNMANAIMLSFIVAAGVVCPILQGHGIFGTLGLIAGYIGGLVAWVLISSLITSIFRLPDWVPVLMVILPTLAFCIPIVTQIVIAVGRLRGQALVPKILTVAMILLTAAYILIAGYNFVMDGWKTVKSTEISFDGQTPDRKWGKDYVNNPESRGVPSQDDFDVHREITGGGEIELGDWFYHYLGLAATVDHQLERRNYQSPFMVFDAAGGNKAEAIAKAMYQQKVIKKRMYNLREGNVLLYVQFAQMRVDDDERVQHTGSVHCKLDFKLRAKDERFQRQYVTDNGRRISPDIKLFGSFEGDSLEDNGVYQLLQYDEVKELWGVYDGYIFIVLPEEYREYYLDITNYSGEVYSFDLSKVEIVN